MKERESFGSRLGFILVSAGCAIGIGNVWKFPYLVGENGGGFFVLLYLVFLLIMGVPVMTMELAVGRRSRKSGAEIQGTGGERYGAIGLRQEGVIGCEKIKYYNKMSKICQITGKKAMGGCNVSHSKRHTKRTFDVNLVSAAGLRTINKIGLDAALKNAAEKGYLYK